MENYQTMSDEYLSPYATVLPLPLTSVSRAAEVFSHLSPLATNSFCKFYGGEEDEELQKIGCASDDAPPISE